MNPLTALGMTQDTREQRNTREPMLRPTRRTRSGNVLGTGLETPVTRTNPDHERRATRSGHA